MRLKLVSLLVLCVGSALLVGALIRGGNVNAKRSTKLRSFVVHYLASRSDDGKTLTPYEYRIRAVSPDGGWKETRYSFDNRVATWGADSTGLYTISGSTKNYYGESNSQVLRTWLPSTEDLKNSPQYLKTDVIAGLQAYVLRTVNGDESSYSPETGATTLKEVIVAEKGSDSIVHQIEALKVEFRELSDSETQLPNLPLKFEIAEQRIRAMREAGLSEAANDLEQAMRILRSRNQ